MLKHFFAAALVLSALAMPLAARCETKAGMLLSAPGEVPGGNGVFYNDYFDADGNVRNFSGLNFDLDVAYPSATNTLHFCAGSFRRAFDGGQSFYAGIGMETDLAPGITAGLEAGALTNYAPYGEDKRLSPVVIPYLRFGDEDSTHLNLMAMPPIDGASAAIGFRLTIPLQEK